MLLQATVFLATCAMTLSYPVSYITNPEQGQPQQQRLPAGPPPPQYRYVQQQPQQVYQQQAAEPIYRQPQQVYQQQAQQPQQVYQQQAQPLQAQRPRKLRPIPGALPQRVPIGADGNPSTLQDQEYDADPSPYQFSFDVRDDLNTNYQNRKEQREGDKITGSYSVVDSDGFIRTVKYTADPLEGFKAEVTREPTDIKVIVPTPPPQQQQTVRQQQTQQYLEAAPQFQQPQQYVRRPSPQAPRVQQVRQQYAEPAEAPQQYAAPAKAAAYYAPQPQQQQQQYQGYQQ